LARTAILFRPIGRNRIPRFFSKEIEGDASKGSTAAAPGGATMSGMIEIPGVLYRILLPAVAIAGLSACVVFDEELVYDDGTPYQAGDPADPRAPDDDPARPGDPDEGPQDIPDDPDPPVGELVLTPDSAAPGETVIVFVDADVPVFDGTDSVRLFGPPGLNLDAFSIDDAETLVLSLSVEDDAPSGVHDLLVQLDDGTALFEEAAFFVEVVQ
jgi:hypothetical protein